ncbi:hypothetical protein CL628_04060 [bacterium]|nr:hypothetical protein [bacterium]
MRVITLVLLIAWVVGTGLGIFGAAWLVVGLTILVSVAMVLAVRQPKPVLVAAAGLLFLGTLYGYSAIPAEHNCVPATPAVGTVLATRERAVDIQYTVRTDDGCTVLVTAAAFPAHQVGSRVTLVGGTVRSLAATRDFSPGYADYLIRQGITSTWQYPSITGNGGQPKSRTDLETVRGVIGTQVRSVFTEPDASIVSAMLLAQRGRIPADIVDQFRHTGVSHVLAISGLHISLVAGMMLAVLVVLPVKPWTRAAILLVLLWSYVWLIGLPVSAVRAGWFLTIAVIGFRLHLLLSLPTILLLTVTGLVSFNPTVWQDVGFQLSVSAVLGIFLALFASKPWREAVSVLPQWLMSLVVVSVGAGLATAPLVAYHFAIVTPVSLIANLLVVPIVPFVIAGSAIALAVGLVAPGMSVLLAYPVHLLLSWAIWVTAQLSNLPWAYRDELIFSLPSVTIYYLVLVTLTLGLIGWQKQNWREMWQ